MAAVAGAAEELRGIPQPRKRNELRPRRDSRRLGNAADVDPSGEGPEVTDDSFTYGPERVFVPICVRYEHGFLGGPMRYEERTMEEIDSEPIIVDVEPTERKS